MAWPAGKGLDEMTPRDPLGLSLSSGGLHLCSVVRFSLWVQEFPLAV